MIKEELKNKLAKTVEEWDEKPLKTNQDMLWVDHLNDLVEMIIEDFKVFVKGKCSLVYDELSGKSAKK